MSDMPQISTSTAKTSVQPRRNEHGKETDLGVTIQSGNGTTDYGEIPAGTPIGKITDSGLSRSCGKTTVDGAQLAATEVTVDDSSNFHVGDVVQILDAATGVEIATKTLTGVNKSTETITFVGAVDVGDGDIVRLDADSATMAGADTCVGVLLYGVNTFNKDLGPVGGHTNVPGVVGWHGHFYDAHFVGGNDLIRDDLPACKFD